MSGTIFAESEFRSADRIGAEGSKAVVRMPRKRRQCRPATRTIMQIADNRGHDHRSDAEGIRGARKRDGYDDGNMVA
jgi:hypothetical protein